MAPSGGKPLREYIHVNDYEMIVAWSTVEFELYVALWPLIMQPAAVAACMHLLRWLRKDEKSLFMTGTRP